MKIICLSIFLFALIVGALSADTCHYADTKHEWAVGEEYAPLGKCILYTCTAPNEFSAKGCAASAAIGCESIPQDDTKPWPDCCPSWKCP